MDNKEQTFTQLVREHKSTIYSVCYMFSKDSDEIDDLDPFEDTDDRALQTKRLYARINRLGLVDRAIILLWLEGLSYEEIGAIMGISYFFAFVVLATLYMTSMNISTELMWRRGIFIAILCIGTLTLEYVYAKRLLKSCDDIIDRLQMNE